MFLNDCGYRCIYRIFIKESIKLSVVNKNIIAILKQKKILLIFLIKNKIL